MQLSNLNLAGTVLFTGAAQFVLAMIMAEALYPGYSTSTNYISDLGVGPSALIFNTSVFLLGVAIVAGTYLIYRTLKPRLFTVLLTLAGVGAMGVGIFTENFPAVHPLVSIVTFLFGSLAAISSYRLIRTPLRYLSVILGLFGLIALIFMASGITLGLGVGGVERMIAYPILLWGMGFGGHLANQRQETKTTVKE
jgi:hypothetical membrane protein